MRSQIELAAARREPPQVLQAALDRLFVKEQVGHRYMSTTALYTGVSSDYKQRALAAALDAQLAAMGRL